MVRRRNTKDPRWQLERERFQIEETYPSAPDRTEVMASILPRVLKKLGLEDNLWERTLTEEWATLVGPQVAGHTRPGRLERGIIHVFVENSVWMQELRHMSEKVMLERLQERFGKNKIKGLRLQLDPDGPQPHRRPSRPPADS